MYVTYLYSNRLTHSMRHRVILSFRTIELILSSLLRSLLIHIQYETMRYMAMIRRCNQREIRTPKAEVGKTELTNRYPHLENIS